MLRAGLFTVSIVCALGSVLASPVAQAQGHGRHWDHGRFERHQRWEGRAYDHREWNRRDWDRHYVDRAGRRRYWNGFAWVYLLPPPPHPRWHWDVTLGRYCP